MAVFDCHNVFMNMLRVISCSPHANLFKLKLIEYRKAIFEMENGRMQGRSTIKNEKVLTVN